MEYFEFRALNSDILLAAEGKPELLARGFGATRDWIVSSETRLSRFLKTSELSRLNRATGTLFSASAELFEIVREARKLFDETDGLFDPSILSALEQAGYDKSMDAIRAEGVDEPADMGALLSSHFDRVELDERACTIRLPRGMRIDLGGIAKGWIAEQAAGILIESAAACAVDAGGDIFLIGQPEGSSREWQIGLEDPRDPSRTLAVVHVSAGAVAVATSSITKRRWMQGEHVRHHLIDPRTGVPAETDWLSVTAVAPHATVAEVFAKALLIAGSRGAERLAARRSDLAFIAVDAEGQLWGSPNSKELLDVGFQYA